MADSNIEYVSEEQKDKEVFSNFRESNAQKSNKKLYIIILTILIILNIFNL